MCDVTVIEKYFANILNPNEHNANHSRDYMYLKEKERVWVFFYIEFCFSNPKKTDALFHAHIPIS